MTISSRTRKWWDGGPSGDPPGWFGPFSVVVGVVVAGVLVFSVVSGWTKPGKAPVASTVPFVSEVTVSTTSVPVDPLARTSSVNVLARQAALQWARNETITDLVSGAGVTQTLSPWPHAQVVGSKQIGSDPVGVSVQVLVAKGDNSTVTANVVVTVVNKNGVLGVSTVALAGT